MADLDLSRENVELVALQMAKLRRYDVAAMLRALVKERDEQAAEWRLANEHDANERAAALALIHDLEAERDALRQRLEKIPDCNACSGKGGHGPGGTCRYTGEWLGEVCEHCGGTGKSVAWEAS